MWVVDGQCGQLMIDVGGSGHTMVMGNGGQVSWLMVV